MIQQGSVINDTYRIDEKIGAGGGGTVYKAYHLRLQKYVVVKRINDAWVGVMDSRKEADIIKNLKHQYLPQAYDFLHLNDGIYTVMDFVAGESLDKYIKSGCQFRQEQILFWAKQITEALVYLHSLTPPIIHSDIKPANIMITLEGNVCLIDFNVSMTGTPDSSISATSRGYAAPEQYLNIRPLNQPQQGVPFVPVYHFDMRSPLDPRSDIYSLGATLYHLMTSQRPPKLPEERLPEIPLDLQGYDEALIGIVNKMTRYDPRERYQSAQELLYDLQNIEKLDKRYIRKKRRRIVFAVVLAALIAAAALTGLFFFLNGQKQSEQAYADKIRAADHLAQQSDLENAEKTYREAMEMNHDDILSYYGILKLYSAQEDHDKVIQYGTDILAEHRFENAEPKTLSEFYYMIGNAYFEQENYPKAIEYDQKALQLNEDHAELYRDLAISLARSGNVAKAQELLQKAEGRSLSADTLTIAQAEISLAQQHYTEAAAAFEKAVQISSDSRIRQRALLSLARAYRESGSYEKALATLSDHMAQFDTAYSRSARLLTAEIYLKMADETSDTQKQHLYAQQAVDAYTAAGGVQSKTTLFNLATAYQYLDDTENAQNILNRMLTDYPEDPDVFARLAILEIYKQQKLSKTARDYSKFKDYYDRAERLDQKNKINGTSSSYIHLMETYMQELGYHN